MLSLLATNSWNGRVVGLRPLQAQYVRRYGPGYYVPNVFIQYWSMRVMAYLAGLILLFGLLGLWLLWRRKAHTSRWFLWCATWAVITPFIMNTAGWFLTEIGRQPWIVQGLQLTRDGVSPSVSFTSLVISLTAFAVVYATLAVVNVVLMLRFARRDLPEAPAAGEAPVPAMQY